MAEAQGRQMMYTEDELTLIKATFKNNEKLLKLMRKVFLPEYDPNAPLGQVIDLWLSLPVNAHRKPVAGDKRFSNGRS